MSVVRVSHFCTGLATSLDCLLISIVPCQAMQLIARDNIDCEREKKFQVNLKRGVEIMWPTKSSHVLLSGC